MLLRFLWNPDPVIFHHDRRKLMIRIQRNLDIAILIIVFDRILHQIGDCKRQLHFIDLCKDLPCAFIQNIDITLLCDRTQAF